MAFHWKNAFSKIPECATLTRLARNVACGDLTTLKRFLDLVHIKYALLKPYFETLDYPVVVNRELLPSFEVDLFEYKDLPGFSMVALPRQLSFFQEIFQYDNLHSPEDAAARGRGGDMRSPERIRQTNLNALTSRVPKIHQETLRRRFTGTDLTRDITSLTGYPALLEALFCMERAHVLARNSKGRFHLAGVYSSFPSYFDAELKQFGLRIGKFAPGDNAAYERNRQFVYQFLMELYGFPVTASERRTSAAMFARRLHRTGEDFLVRVLGQSDRTITTMYSHPDARHYPRVEKLALARVPEHFKDTIQLLQDGGYFIDAKQRVVILRVVYSQHNYDPDNVRQERALSVVRQEIVHPLTGEAVSGLNIIQDSYSMFLRLNDIVRGEHHGSMAYKRLELIHGTETEEKRLKFLYAWLTKHQRRIIGYSDEFYANMAKVLDGYLLAAGADDRFARLRPLHQEVLGKYSYIRQARTVKSLEDILARQRKGRPLSTLDRLSAFCEALSDLKFQMTNYFDELVSHVIRLSESLLQDRYLHKHFVHRKEDELSSYGQKVKKMYGRLVSLSDEFIRIRRLRADRTNFQAKLPARALHTL
ncbi:MAG: hypothetical protein FWF44_11940 [Defluviitaleaceae bacterium]|nr:hypothetical protein [Defluviitaleaceae bacterium]